MAVYAFKARDALGKWTGGTLVADSAAEGRQKLRDRGLDIERFNPAKPRQTRTWIPSEFGPRRDEQVAEFARLLALLLRSNVTLSEGVDILIAQARGRWQVVLRSVRETLDGGTSLADALDRHPEWFGTLFTESVRVGEHAGTLDAALSHLAEFLKERRSLSSQLTTAAVYPLILMAVATGVVLFLMSYVIPQLLTVLTATGQDLPISTLLLKTLSDLLLGWWPLLLCLSAGLSGVVALLMRTARGKRLFHQTQLRTPLLGVLIRKALVARFAQQMSMMLASGVPFVEAVRVVRRSARNVVLAAELEAVEAAVEAGSDIAAPLASSRIFPPLVARLVAVGQNSGELTEVLGQLRAGYETEVRVAVTRFTAALEPMLIIAMAAVVGFIVLATLMPILQVTRGMV